MSEVVSEEQLKELKNMTDVLNYIKRRMLEQGEKCESEDGFQCHYRKDEKCCGIGFIIPDKKLNIKTVKDNAIAYEVIEELKEYYCEIGLGFITAPQNMTLLNQVQECHDNSKKTSFKEDFIHWFDQLPVYIKLDK